MESNNRPQTFVVGAAGGNPTAIRVLECTRDRAWYAEIGAALLAETSGFGAEQAGFLIPSAGRFEMAGGEFCGNAARAAALLLSRLTGQTESSFAMSGCPGQVLARVNWRDSSQADVTCSFIGLRAELRATTVDLEEARLAAAVVDLGGIVHVILDAPFPADFERQQRAVVRQLGLSNRPAVGVGWIARAGGRVTLHPVVWVRALDTLFYETACGSGSIAAALATGSGEIVQPSGEPICVERDGAQLALRSRMEVLDAQ